MRGIKRANLIHRPRAKKEKYGLYNLIKTLKRLLK
jgi:hypothetical protein